MMRYIYIFIIVSLLNFKHGRTQPNCTGVLPLPNTEAGSTFDPINGFDWTTPTYDVIVREAGESCGPYTVPSPFYAEQGQSNTQHFGLQTQKDYLTEMGWELVMVNFGQANPCVFNNTPSFILYNRYTATLRCFHLIPFSAAQGISFNKAYVRLNFEPIAGKTSGALEYVNAPFTGLDDFAKEVEGRALNAFNTSNDFWLYADFPINYDPCTPFHSTKLWSEPILQSISDIVLITEGGGTVKPIVTSNSSPISQLFNTLLGPFSAISSKGNKYTKTLDGYDAWGQELVDLFKLKKRGQEYIALDPDDREAFNKQVAASKLPGWFSDINHIGHLVGIADFLVGGSTSSVTSYEFKLNLTTSGSETKDTPFSATQFFVPGSHFTNPSSELVPTYNNVMGVFTLLETPEVSLIASPSDDDAEGDYIPYYQDVLDVELTSPIKYVINPASGLEVKDIGASLILEGCTSSQINLESDITSPNIMAASIGALPSDPATYFSPIIPLDCISEYRPRFKLNSIILNNQNACVESVKLRLSVTLSRKSTDPFAANATDDEFIQVSFETNETLVHHNSTRPALDGLANIPFSRKVESLNLTEDMTISAWGDIEVGEDIMLNGHKLTLIAGKEIIVPSGIDIDSSIDLLIGQPASCIPVLQQTDAEICDFCNTVYEPTSSLRQNNVEIEGNSKCLAISPNPARESVQFSYTTIEGEEDVTIRLFDNLGKKISEWPLDIQLHGDHTMPIDVSLLNPGSYFFQLTSSVSNCSTILVKQ